MKIDTVDVAFTKCYNIYKLVTEVKTMSNYIRIPIKIVLSPLLLFLNIILLICKAILHIASGIMGVLSMLCVLSVVASVLIGSYEHMIIPMLILAFLLSPFGIPMIGIFITASIELTRDRMREI